VLNNSMLPLTPSDSIMLDQSEIWPMVGRD
jgi:hypothetical protein